MAIWDGIGWDERQAILTGPRGDVLRLEENDLSVGSDTLSGEGIGE